MITSATPNPAIPNLPSIATVLVPGERARVDAAGEGLYRAYHRDTLDDVVRDLKEQRVSAVLVSVARCGDREATQVAGLVREFPRVPAVALLTQLDPTTPHAVLTLGQSGVRTLIDVRQPNGWRELRETLLAERSSDVGRVALAQLVLDLVGSPDDCWRFFESLFTSPTRVTTVRQLARRLQVLPTTLMSRFFRAQLPAPKRYLAMARLVRAARVLENPGLSIADVSNHLDYSSPQSFGRHVRTMLSLTAVEFRQRYDGESMVRRFREELVLPHRETLRSFTPLTNRARWSNTTRQKVA
jgi:AraC-like DNA-binding protein